VADLNRVYRAEPALWEVDFRPEGFEWLVGDASEDNVFAFARRGADRDRVLACVANLSPAVRESWQVPLPVGGTWRVVLNTDAAAYGGTDVGPGVEVVADAGPLYGREASARVTLPPLGVLWLVPA
jgi:1,4-alpha-glucan branching enzyme